MSMPLWFQNAWQSGMDSMGPAVFATVGTFVIHESFYFGSYVPFYLADFFPSLQKYKIQQNRANDRQTQLRCLKRVLFNHFFIQLPMILLLHPALHVMGMRMDSASFPSFASLMMHAFVYLVIEDLYFYWIHRLLHWGVWYKYIHKIHHVHSAPFGMTAEYAHPVETVFLGFGTMIGPLLFSTHLLHLWFWLVVRLMQTVEAHSGYDFPFSLNNWVPGWGGAEFHDFHHMQFIGNYSSTFRWWDFVFGTDKEYKQWKSKKGKLGSAKKVH